MNVVPTLWQHAVLTLTQICQVLFNINIGVSVRIKITHAIAPVNLHSSNGITGVSERLSHFDILVKNTATVNNTMELKKYSSSLVRPYILG